MKLILGDCLEKMKEMKDNSVDSIVTDPPYGIKFMSKKWDYAIPQVEVWEECLRVLKPGGFLLSFGGCRTYHRPVCNIEDAGFTIHPLVAWITSQGFPKATNLSKNIDKAAGAEREVVGVAGKSGSIRNSMAGDFAGGEYLATTPATDAAKQWDGFYYGLQCLKPSLEPICMAQKPYDGKPIESIQKWGCGALNIDGCRVGTGTGEPKPEYLPNRQNKVYGKGMGGGAWTNSKGRHPANLILDGSEEVIKLFPQTKPSKKAPRRGTNANPMDWGNPRSDGNIPKGHDDDGGSAARFFKQCRFTEEEITSIKYCAKASKKDRNEGLEDIEEQSGESLSGGGGTKHPKADAYQARKTGRKNSHPTVKPLSLCKYLCRLITPPGGIILDPYMGSGSTGKAALAESFDFIGIELEEEYFEIAKRRVVNQDG